MAGDLYASGESDHDNSERGEAEALSVADAERVVANAERMVELLKNSLVKARKHYDYTYNTLGLGGEEDGGKAAAKVAAAEEELAAARAALACLAKACPPRSAAPRSAPRCGTGPSPPQCARCSAAHPAGTRTLTPMEPQGDAHGTSGTVRQRNAPHVPAPPPPPRARLAGRVAGLRRWAAPCRFPSTCARSAARRRARAAAPYRSARASLRAPRGVSGWPAPAAPGAGRASIKRS